MHLTKLASGTWRVSVKHDRRRATGTAPTKGAAERLGAELLLAMGGSVSKNASVADLLATVIADGAERWSPTYRADVISVVDEIPDTFLRRPARNVTPTIIAGLYRQLGRDGWSPHRLRRLHEVLSSAWQKARRYEVVAVNPVSVVPKPSAPPRRLTVPTDADVRAILDHTRSDVERLALRLAGTLATRRGETVALRWSDVDFDTATIIVRNSLVYTPDTGITERDTKTGHDGQRPLASDLPLMASLRRHHTAQRELALAAGVTSVWVFSDDAGVTPWRPDRLTHIFAAARGRAGVKGARLHDLRHYVATGELHRGRPLAEVSDLLGHKSIATTAGVYNHFLPGRGRDSVDERGAILDG